MHARLPHTDYSWAAQQLCSTLGTIHGTLPNLCMHKPLGKVEMDENSMLWWIKVWSLTGPSCMHGYCCSVYKQIPERSFSFVQLALCSPPWMSVFHASACASEKPCTRCCLAFALVALVQQTRVRLNCRKTVTIHMAMQWGLQFWRHIGPFLD
jgi:hypothetical protein